MVYTTTLCPIHSDYHFSFNLFHLHFHHMNTTQGNMRTSIYCLMPQLLRGFHPHSDFPSTCYIPLNCDLTFYLFFLKQAQHKVIWDQASTPSCRLCPNYCETYTFMVITFKVLRKGDIHFCKKEGISLVLLPFCTIHYNILHINLPHRVN